MLALHAVALGVAAVVGAGGRSSRLIATFRPMPSTAPAFLVAAREDVRELPQCGAVLHDDVHRPLHVGLRSAVSYTVTALSSGGGA